MLTMIERLQDRRITVAGLAFLVVVSGAAVATTAEDDGISECPVTIPPQPGHEPADPARALPSIDGAVWYGDAELWTVLSTDGTYLPRKSVWWSELFEGGHVEEKPDIEVTWERIDADRPDVVVDEGTNAFTAADGWFMIAGIDPDEPGCWRVTAEYRAAELSYIYERPDEPVSPDVSKKKHTGGDVDVKGRGAAKHAKKKQPDATGTSEKGALSKSADERLTPEERPVPGGSRRSDMGWTEHNAHDVGLGETPVRIR